MWSLDAIFRLQRPRLRDQLRKRLPPSKFEYQILPFSGQKYNLILLIKSLEQDIVWIDLEW